MEQTPCPYKPFGFTCTKGYGHGSPHNIDVEAADVESVLAAASLKHETDLLVSLKNSPGVIVDSALYDAIIEAENRPPKDMPGLRALLQGPSVLDDD